MSLRVQTAPLSGVFLATLLMALLPSLAESQGSPPRIISPYHSDCVISNPAETIEAKTGERHEVYEVRCSVKFVVSGKPTRIVWEGPLVIPLNSTHRDVMLIIDDWQTGEEKKIIAADRKGRK